MTDPKLDLNAALARDCDAFFRPDPIWAILKKRGTDLFHEPIKVPIQFTKTEE